MKKSLVVVDMQNDFIDGPLGTPEARAIVPNVVKKIKNFDGEIVVTLDTHNKNYLETLEGEKLPIPHCINLTSGWLPNTDIMDALSMKKTIQTQKHTFGAPSLNYLITTRDASEVEIVGVCTDICVVSNALYLRMCMPDIKITVDASCCAGTTPEKHRAALEVMKSCLIDVIGE